MPGEQMVELRLDVAAASQAAAETVLEQVRGFGITITTLAQERPRDPHALMKLYSLALVVHDRPRWTLEEYLQRFDRWEAVFIATTGTAYVGYTYLTERETGPEILHQCMSGRPA